ncbi:MAG: formylglycine-generating enzyme family protein, partial [Deltaproteobacteria bacterium]|nr:formylglycine-generating enzyme family protein [Deltaproteobacteria bacterium]
SMPGRRESDGRALADAEGQVAFTLEDMLAVPQGRFWMGCDKDRDSNCEKDEYPERIVELDGYAIDRTEVTWADYRACVAAGACSEPVFEQCWVWTGLDQGFVLGAEVPEEMLADDHPVMCVNWTEALGYCLAAGKRLPTEAEWERAARGLDRRFYPWGNEEPDCSRAIIDGCGDFTAPVASAPAGASPVGALDMAGNVAEWVYDWWDEVGYGYRHMPSAINPEGPVRGEVRGVRGGSFYGGALDQRSSYRYGLAPGARMSIVGFRCAR